MSYQQYVRCTRKITEEPLVKISSNGIIYLNTFIMRSFFPGIKYVILLYDTEKKSFAVKQAKQGENGAYVLGFSSKISKSTGFIAARGFVNLPFMQKAKGKQLKAIWNEKLKILEVTL